MHIQVLETASYCTVPRGTETYAIPNNGYYIYIYMMGKKQGFNLRGFPHSNFAVYVLFTSSYGRGLLRVKLRDIPALPREPLAVSCLLQ